MANFLNQFLNLREKIEEKQIVQCHTNFEIMKAVKNMLQFGESEEKIMKYTGISKEELENIKGTLIH